MDVFGPHGNLLIRLMDAAGERARVVAGNISNQNTPGYKRQVYAFEQLLSEELKRSNPSLTKIDPKQYTDKTTPAGANGNNVHMEKEVATMKENLLRFEMYATIMKGSSQIVQSAIHGDR